VARLDGVGFQLAPDGERAVYLPVNEPVMWHWSIKPSSPGQQRLSVTLLLRWVPTEGTSEVVRESVVFSKGLDIQVTSFFGMTRRQAMAGGMIGLLFGTAICVYALVPLLRRDKTRVRTRKPDQQLIIEGYPGLVLSTEEETLLRALFRNYGRLVLVSEFLSGYSGARTLLVQPLRRDEGADAHTIVKIGMKEAIMGEFENYETFVKHTLPPVTARIQGAPVSIPRGAKAALQYTFIARPGEMPGSLRQALMHAPDPSLLNQLFETFGPNWWMQRSPYTFRIAQEYDRLLPTHYVVEPDEERGLDLNGKLSPGDVSLDIGDVVTLRNFPIIRKRADGYSLSLKGELTPGQAPLRVRWMSTSNPQGANGRIITTRWTHLREIVSGFEPRDLPDPIVSIPDLLNESVNGTQSTIHGDLNLENVLVGPGDFVWLIDFATTRQGHPLYDFAHLEAEIISHVIAPQIDSITEYLDILEAVDSAGNSGLSALLSATREIAWRCLFNPSQRREYYLASFFACLGGLKYKNLEPLQKHLLYLTASHTLKNHLIG
jgi:hypothetical protein